MGVVYFSIIPTFEPSRYCKCWIVCFYNRNIYGFHKGSGENQDGNILDYNGCKTWKRRGKMAECNAAKTLDNAVLEGYDTDVMTGDRDKRRYVTV